MGVAEPLSAVYVRVVAEADPSVLPRVLARFQDLNFVPCRLVVEWGAAETLYIQVYVAGMSEGMLTRLTAKLAELPPVLSAYWCQ